LDELRVDDDLGVQHLGDRPRELIRANRYPGGQRERLRLAVDQGQRRCRPQFDVRATTALDGAQQVLLTDMLGRFHHDLIPGAFGLVVDPTFQDGGAHCRQLGGDLRQRPEVVLVGDADPPERLRTVESCPGVEGGRVQPPGQQAHRGWFHYPDDQHGRGYGQKRHRQRIRHVETDDHGMQEQLDRKNGGELGKSQS
jgi:hypothetical protein